MAQLPNGITAVRVVLAIAFPLAPESWHLTIIAIALASEFLDGFVARLLKVDSYFGQVFDPVADKLFFASVAITWILIGKLSLLHCALLGIRDIGVLLITLIVALCGRIKRVKSVKARMLSKIATTLQYIAMLCILFDMTRFLTETVYATAIFGMLAVAQYVHLLRQSARNAPT